MTYRANLLCITRRSLGAFLLTATLVACGGGGDSAIIGQKVLNGPLESKVENFTPNLPDTNSLRIKALRADAPSPSRSIVLGSAAAEVALAKSSKRASAIGKPPQIGIGRRVTELASNTDFSQRLQWRTSASGSQQVAIRFVSPGATGIRLAIAVTDIDPRTLLRVYGQSAITATEVTGIEVIDTIYRNLAEKPADAASRLFYAPYVAGQEVTLELELPGNVSTASLDINVPRLSHLYQSPESETGLLKIGESGSCQVDTACRSDWGATGNGTARMVFSDPASGGTYACSGTLLNDRASSGAPYLLTASHCISSQASASTLQTFWFYRASSCGSGRLYSGVQVVSGGATLLYSSNTTDTTFLRLNNSPPSGVTYNGWSPNLVSSQSDIGGVHHPKADVQKVSLGQTSGFAACTPPDSSSSFSCTYTSSPSSATHLRVNWSSGVTEAGSSGSGVFQVINGNRYLVGQLSGGTSSCAAQTGTDVYGRFDLAYQAVLYKWLDDSGPSRTAIYRFYNSSTGAHFFTASSGERDYVIATDPKFRYEGAAFYAYAAADTGLSAVYRFYNTLTGAHFYTMNTAERDNVIVTLPQFKFEGPAWYAKSASDGNNNPLYRFYNTSTGAHFYTMSAGERDYVIATIPKFKFEGVAYYAWEVQ